MAPGARHGVEGTDCARRKPVNGLGRARPHTQMRQLADDDTSSSWLSARRFRGMASGRSTAYLSVSAWHGYSVAAELRSPPWPPRADS